MTLSPAQQAYSDQLDTIEAEKLAALNAPGANAEPLSRRRTSQNVPRR